MEFRWIEWNEDHIWKHRVHPYEAEDVVRNPGRGFPRAVEDDKYIVMGQSRDGRYLQVVYVFSPEDTIFVIHARELKPKEKRAFKEAIDMATKPKPKPYWEMTTAELAEATRRFEGEIDIERDTRPLTSKEREQHKRAIRRPGRPRVGRGAKVISLSLERGVLESADKFAAEIGASRAQVVTMALLGLITSAANSGIPVERVTKKRATRKKGS